MATILVMRWMLIVSLLSVGGCAAIRNATNTPRPVLTEEQQREKIAREEAISAQERAGFFAGLGAFGSSLQQSDRTSAVIAGCASDYECAYGSRCVKPYYESTGSCYQEVRAVGVPTYARPSSDSVGVNTPSSPGRCPANPCASGFHCQIETGACVQ